MVRKTVIGVTVIAVLVGSVYGFCRCYYRYNYPFGMYHRCDKQLWSALRMYAEAHGGNFPSGQATPEASLSLLGRQFAYLLPRRDVAQDVVEQMLNRGELLDPDTCGWNYVEGLRVDSNPKLALFWDKEGLDEMGGRLSDGGHLVSTVGGWSEYVPASRWNTFLNEQQKLLAEERSPNRNAMEAKSHTR